MIRAVDLNLGRFEAGPASSTVLRELNILAPIVDGAVLDARVEGCAGPFAAHDGATELKKSFVHARSIDRRGRNSD